jgi:sugar O-acyltransferase (sialic acid O-acetyltransferase NeuD family)
MMKEIVVFGAGRIAEVVIELFHEDERYKVVGCTVDREYLPDHWRFSIPIYPFEEIEEFFTPENVSFFVALGYQQLNRLRTEKILAVKEKGFSLISFVHQYAQIPSSVVLGENCFIMNGVDIQPHVHIEDNVFLWNGALIGHHSVIESNCWIASHAVVAGGSTICRGSFLGVNCVVSNDIQVGAYALIGAQALVNKDVPEKGVIIQDRTPLFRLNSDQFLRIPSSFISTS